MCHDCSLRLHTTAASKLHLARELIQVGETRIWRTARNPPWGDTIHIHCSREPPTQARVIQFIQHSGQKRVKVIKCRCCSWGSTLMKLGYWPSSPKNPRKDECLSANHHALTWTCRISFPCRTSNLIPRTKPWMRSQCLHVRQISAKEKRYEAYAH
jgi:hypothetical protein